VRFDETTTKTQRAGNKAALAKELGLDPSPTSGGRRDGPLFGVVARLSWQKGIDMLLPLVPELVNRGARFAIVGEGDRHLEEQLVYLASNHPRRVGVKIAFDPALSRRVYAGSDFFVIPSRFEPCGLTQMYAMRYGSIPVVTDVGGLHDTVAPIEWGPGVSPTAETGTGILASLPAIDPLHDACLGALRLYDDAPALERAVVRAMGRSSDFGWAASARAYRDIYSELVGPG
jgi:starch synthase